MKEMYLSPVLGEVLSGLLGALGKNCMLLLFILLGVLTKGFSSPIHTHLCHLLLGMGSSISGSLWSVLSSEGRTSGRTTVKSTGGRKSKILNFGLQNRRMPPAITHGLDFILWWFLNFFPWSFFCKQSFKRLLSVLLSLQNEYKRFRMFKCLENAKYCIVKRGCMHYKIFSLRKYLVFVEAIFLWSCKPLGIVYR